MKTLVDLWIRMFLCLSNMRIIKSKKIAVNRLNKILISDRKQLSSAGYRLYYTLKKDREEINKAKAKIKLIIHDLNNTIYNIVIKLQSNVHANYSIVSITRLTIFINFNKGKGIKNHVKS